MIQWSSEIALTREEAATIPEEGREVVALAERVTPIFHAFLSDEKFPCPLIGDPLSMDLFLESMERHEGVTQICLSVSSSLPIPHFSRAVDAWVSHPTLKSIFFLRQPETRSMKKIKKLFLSSSKWKVLGLIWGRRADSLSEQYVELLEGVRYIGILKATQQQKTLDLLFAKNRDQLNAQAKIFYPDRQATHSIETSGFK